MGFRQDLWVLGCVIGGGWLWSDDGDFLEGWWCYGGVAMETRRKVILVERELLSREEEH